MHVRIYALNSEEKINQKYNSSLLHVFTYYV